MILENGKSSNVITAISSGMRIPEAFSSFTQPNAIYWFAQITALGRVCSSSRRVRLLRRPHWWAALPVNILPGFSRSEWQVRRSDGAQKLYLLWGRR